MKNLFLFLLLFLLASFNLYCQSAVNDLGNWSGTDMGAVKRDIEAYSKGNSSSNSNNGNRTYYIPSTPTYYPYHGVNYPSEAARVAAKKKYDNEQLQLAEKEKARKNTEFQQDKAITNSRFMPVSGVSQQAQSAQQSTTDRFMNYQSMIKPTRPTNIVTQSTASTVPSRPSRSNTLTPSQRETSSQPQRPVPFQPQINKSQLKEVANAAYNYSYLNTAMIPINDAKGKAGDEIVDLLSRNPIYQRQRTAMTDAAVKEIVNTGTDPLAAMIRDKFKNFLADKDNQENSHIKILRVESLKDKAKSLGEYLSEEMGMTKRAVENASWVGYNVPKLMTQLLDDYRFGIDNIGTNRQSSEFDKRVEKHVTSFGGGAVKQGTK